MVEQRRPRKSDVIIGSSAWIKSLHEQMSMVAPSDVSVAIRGESGTGKELVARTLHRLSNRYDKPFVVLNCAAIPENLLEDELFGHVKGAYTDASRDREGLFSAADGGTLFLDEIGEMNLGLQAKLLRVLQSQEFRRVGDDKDTKVDVRLITATHQDLEKSIEAGQFRSDLYYRIHVFPIVLLALRERREDIPLLANHFLRLHKDKVGKKVSGFSEAAMKALEGCYYRGNIRELENKILHALVLSHGEWIEESDLPVSLDSDVGFGLDLSQKFRVLKRGCIERFESAYTQALLEHHHGNMTAAAKQSGLDRKNLWSLTKKYNIDVDAIRGRSQ